MGCKAIWRIVRTSEKILATPLDKKKYPVEPRVTEVLSGMAQVGQPPWPKVLCGMWEGACLSSSLPPYWKTRGPWGQG